MYIYICIYICIYIYIYICICFKADTDRMISHAVLLLLYFDFANLALEHPLKLVVYCSSPMAYLVILLKFIN